VTKPIVWTIAGSDSGGGAGIQADLKTFSDLNVYGCTVIAALTAQNSVAVTRVEYPSVAMLRAQLTALNDDLPARVLKCGMLGHRDVIATVAEFLSSYSGHVVIDPVMIASSGAMLLDDDAFQLYRTVILPYATILTPNIFEAERLTGMTITQLADIPRVATELLSMGAQSVYIKGGHFKSDAFCFDYWTDGESALWLKATRYSHSHTHGSGCTLSAAITSALARGFALTDALVYARAYVNRAIREATPYGQGFGPLAHGFHEFSKIDLPHCHFSLATVLDDYEFPDCGAQPLGFYPIVPDSDWVEQLISTGVSTIQLRNKHMTGVALHDDIARAVTIAKRNNVRLFINDHWQQAIACNAYGVHLGQEDLQTANVRALAEAGLRLGISTHSYSELAYALRFNPSYVAVGPIFATTSKVMAVQPQGLVHLQEFRRCIARPLVAIGGIQLTNVAAVIACGVDAVSVISAITEAAEPLQEAQQWLARCEKINQNFF
jgi:hydroxymethylpyrimidine kinase/phosphomethylpyrimidine kinase/thiamine-phosphate diphosphorylase